jgi:hypothetical protein
LAGIRGGLGVVGLDAPCRGVVVAAEGEYGVAAWWCDPSSRALMAVAGRQAAARAGAPAGGAGGWRAAPATWSVRRGQRGRRGSQGAALDQGPWRARGRVEGRRRKGKKGKRRK